MVAWEFGMHIGPKIFMAEEVFFYHVLKILTSEFDKGQEETRLGIKDSCCTSGMSVVIMGAEHGRQTGLVTCSISCIFMFLWQQRRRAGKQKSRDQLERLWMLCEFPRR